MLTIHAIPGRNIVLGIEGENFARSVVFDISDWISAYGIGTVSMIAQRSRDKEPYPCNITVDGNTAVWSITSADTAHHGYGKCELRYSVGDVLVKSETWRTYTADALGTPVPEAPEPQKAWVDKVLEAGQAAVDASVNSPKIGSNGNWWTWDFEAGKYVDTGVAASGGGSGAVSSVNGKTGAVKLTAEDVGAVSVPKTASVGQTIVVKVVDEAGKPTEWEAADMPSGGGSLPEVGTEDTGKFLRVTNAGVPGWEYANNWQEVMTYITSEAEEASNIVYVDFTNNYVKLFVIIDESGISGTTYSSTRFGVIDRNKKRSPIGIANVKPVFLASCKWKTFYAEALCKNLFRYDVTSDPQLSGYVAGKNSGQLFYNTPDHDFSEFGGIAWLGGIYANTKITVYGVKA